MGPARSMGPRRAGSFRAADWLVAERRRRRDGGRRREQRADRAVPHAADNTHTQDKQGSARSSRRRRRRAARHDLRRNGEPPAPDDARRGRRRTRVDEVDLDPGAHLVVRGDDVPVIICERRRRGPRRGRAREETRRKKISFRVKTPKRALPVNKGAAAGLRRRGGDLGGPPPAANPRDARDRRARATPRRPVPRARPFRRAARRPRTAGSGDAGWTHGTFQLPGRQRHGWQRRPRHAWAHDLGGRLDDDRRRRYLQRRGVPRGRSTSRGPRTDDEPTMFVPSISRVARRPRGGRRRPVTRGRRGPDCA